MIGYVSDGGAVERADMGVRSISRIELWRRGALGGEHALWGPEATLWSIGPLRPAGRMRRDELIELLTAAFERAADRLRTEGRWKWRSERKLRSI